MNKIWIYFCSLKFKTCQTLKAIFIWTNSPLINLPNEAKYIER